jgi:hypothetical protein
VSGEDDEGETPFTFDGVKYVAHWAIADNLMTVHVDGFARPQATQVNGADHDWLARSLGTAVVRAG